MLPGETSYLRQNVYISHERSAVKWSHDNRSTIRSVTGSLILLENRDISSRSDLSQRLNFSYLLVQVEVGASFNMYESGLCNGH